MDSCVRRNDELRGGWGASGGNKIKAISENPHTTLRVFLPVFGVVEALTHTSYAQAPRLEDEQKYCAIRYNCFRQSPK